MLNLNRATTYTALLLYIKASHKHEINIFVELNLLLTFFYRLKRTLVINKDIQWFSNPKIIATGLYGACTMMIFSCNYAQKFPLTIDDIDTLTAYNEHLASIKTKEKPVIALIASDTLTPSPDTSFVPKKEEQIQSNQKKWTICTGAFKEKQNAILMFRKLANEQNAYVIVRDSFYFVTVGVFGEKDSARLYRRRESLHDTYIMKIKAGEPLLKNFPD